MLWSWRFPVAAMLPHFSFETSLNWVTTREEQRPNGCKMRMEAQQHLSDFLSYIDQCEHILIIPITHNIVF